MVTLNGHRLDSLLFTNLQKVYDLLEFEGPILSHFKDENDNDILFYWVDDDDQYVRWLVWKISKIQLYYYLKGHLALSELIIEPNKDFVFSVDIDGDLKYQSICAIEIKNLPAAYYVESNTQYNLPIPDVYETFIDSFERDYYLVKLRENALYYTLKPTDLAYSTTVATTEAANFLKFLSDSFESFLEIDFFNKFRDQFSDLDRIKEIIKKFKQRLSLRIVSLEYSSFKVGIAADIIHQVENNAYIDWQRNILEIYKEEVVSIDYTDEGQLRQIVEAYPDYNVRRKIFQPYITLLSNNKYRVEVSNYNRTFKKDYRKIPKEKRNILLPKVEDLQLPNERKRLVTVIYELNEGQDLNALGKRDLKSKQLFAHDSSEVELELDEISFPEYHIAFNEPFRFIFRVEGELYSAESYEFDIFIGGDDRQLVLEQMQRSFVERYLALTSGEDDNEELRAIYESKVHSFDYLQ